ncbi:MAG TPA: hypothetical protein VFI47_07540 [Acidimicrobiales bacterium]|nr:hypothetical protein [Acidimicrobiales bacterium]
MGQTTLYLVFSNPVDGKEGEFNEWYDNVHVREVLATPGMVSAQRYTLRDTEMSRMAGFETPHKYLCVYEMDEDPDVVMGRVQEAVMSGAMQMHEALDLTTAYFTFWSPHGPKVEK